MANAYGTKEHERYLTQYEEWLREQAGDRYEWTLDDTIIQSYRAYQAKLEVSLQKYLFEKDITIAWRSVLTIEKNGEQIYRFEPIYEKSRLLYFYRYNGRDYLLFRKDLYGYTILDLETLEEHNYFPSAVLEKDESFIITDAHIFRDILICEGCFWGYPYMFYLIDLKTFHTYGIWRSIFNDNCVTVQDDCVTLVFESDDDDSDDPDPVTYRYDELKQLLEQSDSIDLHY